MSFVIENGPKDCKAWKAYIAKLDRLRDQFIEFHHKTTEPVPTEARAEISKLSHELSLLITSVLLESEQLLRKRTLCDGSSLDDSLEKALIQTVRAIYASSDRVFKAASKAGTGVELTKTVPETFLRLRELFREEAQIAEKRFHKSACDFLELEWNARCAPEKLSTQSMDERSKSGQNSKPEPKRLSDVDFRILSSQVEKRLAGHTALVEGSQKLLLGKATPTERWLAPSRGLRRDMTAEDWFDVGDAFYDFVVPQLRLCLAKQALERGAVGSKRKARALDPCHRFYCQDQRLLRPPSAGSDIVTREFCTVLGDYASAEALYLRGFRSSIKKAKENHKSTLTHFCPEPAELRRTPPVNQGTTTH